MPAVLSRRSILFIKYILRYLDNMKMLLYKLSVWHLVVKPACVNAALVKGIMITFRLTNNLITYLRNSSIIGRGIYPSVPHNQNYWGD